jgi:hypothetical protein
MPGEFIYIFSCNIFPLSVTLAHNNDDLNVPTPLLLLNYYFWLVFRPWVVIGLEILAEPDKPGCDVTSIMGSRC